jgi:hypothetical protein
VTPNTVAAGTPVALGLEVLLASGQLRCVLIPRPLNLGANYRSCTAFPTHQRLPRRTKTRQIGIGGRYLVVSDGDEGDEAKGKHREVLLRFH